ncbi:LamG-like jellyroll fold domain-containing protein [Hamadaea tsunoensis]|uniref:LamG-like jellyroll fold domain-containing protein n=1 Tax=Hamadaea tsunoensis TaxID=53368 RepID=UPI000403DE9B|nr:LamG-like jellyroll fold domain-containing protein [Hamadaea tsunoensis]
MKLLAAALLAAILVPGGTIVPGDRALASGTTASQPLAGTERVLFRGGTDGYGCFRIPSLVRTDTGVLLAFAEARVSPTCADRGDIDIVVRRSTNDGRTWGPIQVVLSGAPGDASAPYTRGNAAPVVDRSTGRILLLSTSNAATPGGLRLPWVQHSDDEGVTWSAAAPITATFAGTSSGWFATGPAHGVQLRHGAYVGRLVVGAQQSVGGLTYAGVLYSDDGGGTWAASRVAGEAVFTPGEVTVAELPNGSVYANARNNVDPNHRVYSVSADGGTTFPAYAAAPTLVTAQVQGAVLAPQAFYRSTPGDLLLYSGPSDPTNREDMWLRYSADGGRTWAKASKGQLNAQRAGYSDLAELGGGELGVLYEAGADFSADELRFNRISPAALGITGTFTGSVSAQTAPAEGPTTPDASPQANDAYLAGNATVAGNALTLAAPGDYADIPYARSLDVGGQDFSVSLRFRHSATTATAARVLLWAYGVGSAPPQIWVRLQPAQDRVYAWVQGAQGGAAVTVGDPSPAAAFGDGGWHTFTLTRTGGQVTATVDSLTASATGVAGPVTGAAPTGLRLGAKQDSTLSDPFTGSLADVRLTVAGSARLWLPFSVIDKAVAATRTEVPLSDDLSGHCTGANLLGGWRDLVAGRNDTTALAVDPAHPGAESPFTPALDAGAGNLTVATWFKYTAGTGDQVLVWAFGATGGKPSLWVRAQPSLDRIYAWAQTDTATVALSVPDTSAGVAFGDGKWHLLTVRRDGGQVRLGVDGLSATGTGLTGSFTTDTGVLGLRVGSKPDGSGPMTGAVDELRFYRRALTDAELATAAGGAFPADLPSVWWSFDSGYTQHHDVVRATPDSGPATPDSSARCRDAYARGSATPTAGRFGDGVALDGVDDALELSYGAPLALGDRDFTVTTWLRYTATAASPDQVVLWAYGVGATERQLWLRVQPGSDRLFLVAQTEVAATAVSAVDSSGAVAFGDGAWHHLALVRAAGVLSLSVDGVVLGAAPIAGSLTYGDAYAVGGWQFGARLDGADRLTGSLDEIRVFDRALTSAELDAVRTQNADLGSVTRLRLPLDVLSTTPYARM